VIAYVEGILIRREPEAVVAIAEGAVALDVQVPARVVEDFPPVGERLRLWTHLAVREDAWTLFGFPTPDERDMFRLLISVSGVGPKVALGMLSGAPAAAIAGYLRTGDERALIRLPGIGKKSAARLVVELGERIPETLGERGIETVARGQGAGRGLDAAMTVLQAMGLPPHQAERALLAARQEDEAIADDLESWVKAALRRL